MIVSPKPKSPGVDWHLGLRSELPKLKKTSLIEGSITSLGNYITKNKVLFIPDEYNGAEQEVSTSGSRDPGLSFDGVGSPYNLGSTMQR